MGLGLGARFRVGLRVTASPSPTPSPSPSLQPGSGAHLGGTQRELHAIVVAQRAVTLGVDGVQREEGPVPLEGRAWFSVRVSVRVRLRVRVKLRVR